MLEKFMGGRICWCGSGKKYCECHQKIEERIAEYKKTGHIVPKRKNIKTLLQIEGIRESGKVNIAVLDYVAENIRIGMSTEDINQMVHNKTIELGGIPAPLKFEGFPKSVCTSINNQVCHGIPSEDVILDEGDIINVDVSTIYKGYYSDSSRMFCLGKVNTDKQKLVDVAKECVELALQEVKPWKFMGDIGAAITEHAYKNGYKVVREVGGHGVGIKFHEEPIICYITKRNTKMLLVPGMVFTIEPMINMGTDEIFIDDFNNWTIYTADDMPSAQWEVTVVVTEDGYEILAC